LGSAWRRLRRRGVVVGRFELGRTGRRRRRILLGLACFLALDDFRLALGALDRLLLDLLGLALAARDLVQRAGIDHLDGDRLLVLRQGRRRRERKQPCDEERRVAERRHHHARFGGR
jgi:hypothetical protein